MDRFVLRINPPQGTQAAPQLFSAFSESANIVLLGDPGAGKTHLFREAAANEGARWLTARAFLVTPDANLSGQVLFIDGLDEQRGGRGDRGTIDAVVQKLFSVGPSKVRISCRAADWLGESDLAGLRPFFEQGGEPLVLLLQKLSADEQRAVLVAHSIETDRAEAFLAEAEERGLGDFLENPQNLIMLWRAVASGQWPTTRKELFELSTSLMLQESNHEHARAGAGSHPAQSLRLTAGGILAARLIGDVEAIGLTEQEGSQDIPGYRTLSFLDPERMQAALGRRVFVTGAEPETVDYAHRTTAEYLAAAYLARAVRDGLPLGRVIALMGVDGHPASELRGLHAWLAVHLPEHADALIEADPYGVLTYGDAASLTPSSCSVLVRALGNLARSNPWFRSGNWQSSAIGALARTDMADDFRAVLQNANSGSGIRTVIVDALAIGPPLAVFKSDLVEVLKRETSVYVERAHALLALLRMGGEGKNAVIEAFRAGVGTSFNAIRLRTEIIQRLYGDPFGTADVIELVNDMLAITGDHGTGALWTLADRLPLADIPAILDGIRSADRNDEGTGRNRREASSFYGRLLVRAWGSPQDYEPARMLDWLRVRQSFAGAAIDSRARDLRAAMRERPERLLAVANHFLGTFVDDGNRWLNLSRFRQTTLFELSPDTLLDLVQDHMGAAVTGSDREVFFFEASFGLAYSASESHGAAVFARLYEIADARQDLAVIRDKACSTTLPDNYFDRGSQRSERRQDANFETLRHNFETDAEHIRSGAHLGWLAHIARVYFALYSDVDRKLTPRQRLVFTLGEANTEIALAGLKASLTRSDVPTLDGVLALTAEHQHYDWWYALVAGLNERWTGRQSLDDYSDDLIQALLAFDLANPVSEDRDGSTHWVVHPWRSFIVERRAALVRDAFLAVARIRLSRGDQYIEGLHELLSDSAFEPFRKDVALALLRDYPNMTPFRLGDLLDVVTKVPEAHAEFLALARRVLTDSAFVDERQRDMWLVAAYLLSPQAYEAEIEAVAALRPALVFDLRDRSGFAFQGQPEQGALPLVLLEAMARLTGRLFPDVPHPANGWSGNANPWDASEQFRNLANRIAAIPTASATEALVRLETDPQLVSYRDYLRYALANQGQRRRDAEYDRPDWRKTVAALSNGAPATVADLHVLLIEHLQDLRTRIERANTDIFKLFWNVDSYARPERPRPEETCRDAVVTLMRPTLLPLGISVEPEGHMVSDRRADISVAIPGRKILCELKRDYHTDVWTAADEQLERFYAHDPEAKGFGVYCVFWFGDKRPNPIPKPPENLARPQSARDMETMLRDRIPAERRARLAVIVIDVSGKEMSTSKAV